MICQVYVACLHSVPHLPGVKRPYFHNAWSHSLHMEELEMDGAFATSCL